MLLKGLCLLPSNLLVSSFLGTNNVLVHSCCVAQQPLYSHFADDSDGGIVVTCLYAYYVICNINMSANKDAGWYAY